MPTTTTCPSCNGPLRIPDELVGRRVRCPVCQTIFDAASASSAPAPPADPAPAPEPEQPLWKGLRLNLDSSNPEIPKSPPAPEPPAEPTPRPAPARSPRLVGAVELQPSGDEPPAPPRPSSPPPRREPRDDPTDDDDDMDRLHRSLYDRGPRRRDTAPHRGVLILVLGILSLVFTVLSMCYGLGVLVGLPLGITAWVLGSGDLRKIKNQEMDEEGLGITQAGWICGIIGTILHSLLLLTCGAFLAFIIVEASNGPGGPMAPKAPFGGPVPVAPNR